MRLETYEISLINSIVKNHFGADALVYLFGSRVDNNKKGGDIDLFIHAEDESSLTLRKKLSLLTDLKLALGDQKVDIVFDNKSTKEKQIFYQSIISSAKLLTNHYTI